MLRKSQLAAGALIFGGSLFAAPYLSFEVTFPNSVKAGDLQLPADSYRISQHGDQAVFRDLRTDRVYRTPATVEHLDHKNKDLRVEMATVNGQRQIRRIQLGNRSVDLMFNQ